MVIIRVVREIVDELCFVVFEFSTKVLLDQGKFIDLLLLLFLELIHFPLRILSGLSCLLSFFIELCLD